MDSEYINDIDELVEEKPEIKDDLESILKIDKKENDWDFDDVNVDSGHFGEIVSRGIVAKNDGGYEVVHQELLYDYLNNNIGDHNNNTTSEQIQNIKEHIKLPEISIISLVLTGFFLRFQKLNDAPFWIDESFSVSVARGFAKYNEFVLLGSQNPYARAPFNTIIVYTSISVFGTGEFAARLPSVIFGTLTIIIIYLIGKRIDSVATGLIAASFYSIAYFEIAWARQARMYALFQFLFALTIFVFLLYLHSESDRNNMVYLAIGAIVVLLMSQTHKAWIIIMPILVFSSALSIVPKNEKLIYIRWVFFSFTLFYAFILVVVQNPIFPQSIYGIVGIDSSKIGYVNEVPMFFVTHYPVTSIFCVFGLFSSVYLKRRIRSTVLISFWLSLGMLSYFIYSIQPFFWPRYIHFMTPLFFLNASIGLKDSFQFITKNYHLSDSVIPDRDSLELRVIISLTFIAILVLVLPGYGIAIESPSSIHEPQPDYRQAADYLENNGYSKTDTVISTRPNLLYIYGIDVDYVMSPHRDESQDYYTNASTIRSRNEVESIVEQNQHGWIIINTYRDIPGELWIKENLELVNTIEPYPPFDSRNYQLSSAPDTNEEIVYIYRWG
ncbi:ArnT family glycosyltransferase [Haloarcula litorea]|uniref:ArnT family glycosyltransferase n=1 Tax=Haloarcula litorea TaxID=3032579 RepID=UPI0023E8A618|nr:glycosyltransferase family 39 protein [Halomicroarcula sp. GDY20]